MYNRATIRIPLQSIEQFKVKSYVIKDDELIIELIENKNVAVDKKDAIQSGTLERQSDSRRY